MSGSLINGIILAGGFGTRIRELYPEVPKPLIPCHDKAFIDWVILFLEKQGVKKITISSGYLSEKMVQHFSQNPHVNICVEPQPLGTGGGLLYSFHHSPKDSEFVVVCNGDSILLCDLEAILKRVKNQNRDVTMVGTLVNNSERFGTLTINDQNELIGFKEKGNLGPGLINSGIYIFKSSLLENWPVPSSSFSIEFDLIPQLIKMGTKIIVEPSQGDFIDIGTPSSLTQVGAFIQRNQSYFTL